MKDDDVKFLLSNVAQNFLRCFQKPLSADLRVECRPNCLTGKVECRRWFNFRHKYRITLCTGDCCHWSFQFAHELCHIVSNYERFRRNENAWFHEALCDLAAIFTVRRMAASWRQAHLSNWTWFSVAIQEYARALIDGGGLNLPKDVTFATWFEANECNLRADRYQRGKNALIALQLLPIVESNPENWEGIRYLPDSQRVFAHFVSEWWRRCPEPQKRFVLQIAKVFEISAIPHIQTSHPKDEGACID